MIASATAAVSRRSAPLTARDELGQVEALMEALAVDGANDPLGWIVREHLQTGGKRLRARLALDALHALGGERRRGVPWAAACELLHNATLVHDDLQDGDRERRGQPTTWVRHGMSQAINAGDLMLMLPFLALEQLDARAELRYSLVRTLVRHATAAARGQAVEQEITRSQQTDWAAFRQAVVGKTSALFQLPVEGAALLAGWSHAEASLLGSPFHHLGVLFQIQDDLIDLYGDKGRGQPGSDVREGRVSALAVEHLTLHPCERPWLVALLAAPSDQKGDAEVEEVRVRFREGGTLDSLLARMQHEADTMIAALEQLGQPAVTALAAEVARLVFRGLAVPLRRVAPDAVIPMEAAL